MGYYTRNGGIRCFDPDDTDTEMYLLPNNLSLEDIIEKTNEKWPGAKFSDIEITSKKIHTDCLGYDLYDPSDWTDYLIITYIGEQK